MSQSKKQFPLSKIALVLGCTFVVNGCAVDPVTGQPSFKETFNSDDPCAHNARNIGIAAGAVLGAIAGNQIDKKSGKYIGAGVGALFGGLIGADMDRKKCELSKIAKKYSLEMTFVDVSAGTPSANKEAGSADAIQSQNAVKPANEEKLGFSVSLKDHENGGHFLSGSDELMPKAQTYFSEIAAEYSYSKQMRKMPANATAEDRKAVDILKEKRLLIMGHTDDTGNSRLNADLSERRAKNVAKIFRDAGVADIQIFFQGAGETLPIADNRTDEGRAKNRRVEIVDLTDDVAFKKYLATRTVRTDYYRVIETVDAPRPNTPAENHGGTDTNAVSGTALAGNKKPVQKRTPISSSMTAAKKTSAPNSNLVTIAPAVTQKNNKEGNSANAVVPSLNVALKPNEPSFDFGGMPAGSKTASLDIGPLVENRSTFNLIPLAHAADMPALRSCNVDRPRISNGVKSLRDGKEISTAEYMPNLYNTSWSDMVKGNLVALTNVAVLRDGGSPARKPELLIYKDYGQRASSNAKPDYQTTPEVNTYQGEKALLYRVFINGPVRCMDLVIPNASNVASGSWLYYGAQGQTYVASFNPRIAK